MTVSSTFIPPFLSYFLSSFFDSSTFSSHFLPSPCISSSIYAAHLFSSFSPGLPLPLVFTPSCSLSITLLSLSSSFLSPSFLLLPLPLFLSLSSPLSSRYRPHRGVLRLPLRRVRSDHGATASPTEHRDHAAHRQDDRGGKNTLMSLSFCMLSHVVPVTILHQ